MGVFIGFCSFSVAFAIDLEQSLKSMSKRTGSVIDGKEKLSNETEIEMKKNLCEFIRFHSDSKQLSIFKTCLIQISNFN